jgi:hypothetical protein
MEDPNHLLIRGHFQGLDRSYALLSRRVPLVHPVIHDGVAVRQPPGLLQTGEMIAASLRWVECPHRVPSACYFPHPFPVGDQNVSVLERRHAPRRGCRE